MANRRDRDLPSHPSSVVAHPSVRLPEKTISILYASQIKAGIIDASHITVTTLSALAADMGTLTAGSIVIGTTNKIWLNDGDDGALNIGGSTKAGAPFRVTAAGALTATSATITGELKVGSTIGNNVVTTDSIQDDAILEAKINDAAVTTAKLFDGAVSSTKLADAAVSATKLLANGFNNLAENEGFESGDTTWNKGSGWAIAEDATTARRGTWRAAFTGTTAALRNGVVFGVEPGQQYLIQGWFRGDGGANGNAHVRVAFLNADKTVEIDTPFGSSAASTGAYVLSEGFVTAPAGAVFGRAEFVVINCTTGTWYADDIFCVRAVTSDVIVANAVLTTHLAADSVIANKIAANAVGAKQLFVGSFDNLIVNPGFEQGMDGWYQHDGGGIVTSISTNGARSGAQCLLIDLSGQTSSNFAIANRNNGNGGVTLGHVSAAGGDQFYVELYAKKVGSSAVNEAALFIRSLDSAGGFLADSYTNLSGLTTSYQKFSVTHTCPAGTAVVAFFIWVTDSGNSESIHMDDFYARRMVEGSVVVDGTITTSHLETGTLSASNITAGTLTADAIVASTSFTAASPVFDGVASFKAGQANAKVVIDVTSSRGQVKVYNENDVLAGAFECTVADGLILNSAASNRGVQLRSAGALIGQFSPSGVIGTDSTGLLLLVNRGGSVTTATVSIGASNSGGSGFRLLRVSN